MFKAVVRAAEAAPPFNTFDSMVEIPSGSNPEQNAWLTLQLRVKLNFADPKNPVLAPIPGGRNLTVQQGGKWYAQDFDGYLYPLLDWPDFLINRFQKAFVSIAEKTWNWQFVLITPSDYADLDYQSNAAPGWMVRPNLLCLFRMSVLGPTGPIDTSAAGPMPDGPPHRTINVVNISLSTKQVSLAAGIAPTPTKPATKDIGSMDGLTWRSDAGNYDDSDAFNPAWWNPEHTIISNTVGHEIGHALGQCHIMGLLGNSLYQFGGKLANDPLAYGNGPADPNSWNIMGGGDRVWLLNAVSWRERMAVHSGIPTAKWLATGIMTTPTRKTPLVKGS